MKGGIINKVSIGGLCERDPVFSDILCAYGPPPNYRRPEGFETLLRIILEQQVSLESAYAAYRQLKNELGVLSPQTILSLGDQQFRDCYVSRQKTRYLRALASAVCNGELKLEELASLPEVEVRQKLQAIKGVGPWTAEVYLMFALQTPDIFPIGDIAAVNTVKEIKAIQTREEVLEVSKDWQPFRTAATFFLWHYYLKKRNRELVPPD